MLIVGLIQGTVLLFFICLERSLGARTNPIKKHFYLWWIGIIVFALVWLRALIYAWVIELPSLFKLDNVLLFYVCYSFGNYWFHRWKHSNSLLWEKLHSLHHAPNHMETMVAFFRHPLEIIANTVYLILIGKLIFGVSAQTLLIALTIEGCLEVFHHSNINTPKWLRPLGYIIQIPEMHLVHHEKGKHKYNYAPFLWDWVFGTLRIPAYFDKPLGLKPSFAELFFYKKS